MDDDVLFVISNFTREASPSDGETTHTTQEPDALLCSIDDKKYTKTAIRLASKQFRRCSDRLETDLRLSGTRISRLIDNHFREAPNLLLKLTANTHKVRSLYVEHLPGLGPLSTLPTILTTQLTRLTLSDGATWLKSNATLNFHLRGISLLVNLRELTLDEPSFVCFPKRPMRCTKRHTERCSLDLLAKLLMPLSFLKSLDLGKSLWRAQTLQPLLQLPSLQSLGLSYCRDLTSLIRESKMQKGVTCTSASPQVTCSPLCRLTALRLGHEDICHFGKCLTALQCLSVLSCCTNLMYLQILAYSKEQNTTELASAVFGLSKLIELDINFSGCSLPQENKCSGLVSLRLTRCSTTLSSLAGLQDMTKLTKLLVGDLNSIRCLEPLRNLRSSLQALRIDSADSVSCIQPLSSLSHLRSLQMYSMPNVPLQLEILSKLSELTQLVLFWEENFPLEPVNVGPLSALKRLQNLSIGVGNPFDCNNIKGLELLFKSPDSSESPILPLLTSLTIPLNDNDQIQFAGIVSGVPLLSKLTNLELLGTSRTGGDHLDSIVQGLTSLKELSLENLNDLSNHLQPLSQMSCLTRLEIHSCALHNMRDEISSASLYLKELVISFCWGLSWHSVFPALERPGLDIDFDCDWEEGEDGESKHDPQVWSTRFNQLTNLLKTKILIASLLDVEDIPKTPPALRSSLRLTCKSWKLLVDSCVNSLSLSGACIASTHLRKSEMIHTSSEPFTCHWRNNCLMYECMYNRFLRDDRKIESIEIPCGSLVDCTWQMDLFRFLHNLSNLHCLTLRQCHLFGSLAFLNKEGFQQQQQQQQQQQPEEPAHVITPPLIKIKGGALCHQGDPPPYLSSLHSLKIYLPGLNEMVIQDLGLSLNSSDSHHRGALDSLTSLTQLTIDSAEGENDGDEIQTHPERHLTSLDTIVRSLTRLSRLSSLHLGFCNELSTALPLTRLLALRDLQLTGIGRSEFVTSLSVLVHLTSLSLNEMSSRVPSLTFLRQMKELRELDLDFCPRFGMSRLSLNFCSARCRDDLVRDPTNHETITDGMSFDPLDTMPALSRLLYLNLTNIRFSSLQALSQCPNLKSLSIDTKMSFVIDLHHLAPLHHLDQLYLGYTLVQSLSPLSSFTALRELAICFSRSLTNEGILEELLRHPPPSLCTLQLLGFHIYVGGSATKLMDIQSPWQLLRFHTLIALLVRLPSLKVLRLTQTRGLNRCLLSTLHCYKREHQTVYYMTKDLEDQDPIMNESISSSSAVDITASHLRKVYRQARITDSFHILSTDVSFKSRQPLCPPSIAEIGEGDPICKGALRQRSILEFTRRSDDC